MFALQGSCTATSSTRDTSTRCGTSVANGPSVVDGKGDTGKGDDYGPERPPNPLTNPNFFIRMVEEGWDAIVAAVVLVFGLAAGHGPDVYHCVAISCSAGCHRSLSAAMVIAFFVFNMGLWAPSMKKEYDDPEKIPIFSGRNPAQQEVVEVIKELCKIAEIKPFDRRAVPLHGLADSVGSARRPRVLRRRSSGCRGSLHPHHLQLHRLRLRLRKRRPCRPCS
ncbi:unnamed protein product [Symbiodinium sp. CCMP2592]|nr:unnamed protein product [Symbiodinium sp. CCMP2592]